MKNTAFLFPGQGSQKLGMLNDLYRKFSIIKSTFQEASDAMEVDLWEISQSDEKGILANTEITQPVLLSASVAIWRVWMSLSDEKPSAVSGHSLGEYSALVCSGAISFQEAVRLVHFRGSAMQNAVPSGEGKMAAILGLSEETVEEICTVAQKRAGLVSPANINAAKQIVISGEFPAVTLAIELCKEAGAKRALALDVSVPSHCDLMRSAAVELGHMLDSIEIGTPDIKVIQNVDGEIQTDKSKIKHNLVKQLYMPVRWIDCINKIYRLGCKSVVECGPGRVLTGLVKRIQPEIQCFSTDTVERITEAHDSLSQ